MDRVNNSTRLCKTHAVTNTVSSSDPASVDEPNVGLMFRAHLSKLLGIYVRVHRQKGLTETRGEGGDGLDNSHLCTSNLGGVSRDEMVHRLLGFKLGDGRHNTVGIASQENYVLGMTTDGWYLNVFNVL